MTTPEQPKCELCGEPMPPGEEMFKYHGFSGDCPKPPLHGPAMSKAPRADTKPCQRCDALETALRKVRAHTSYVHPADGDLVGLLKGLLASIERIADAALLSAEPPAPKEGCAMREAGWRVQERMAQLRKLFRTTSDESQY